jgi:hypothetical protein
MPRLRCTESFALGLLVLLASGLFAASADDLHDITNLEPAPPAPPRFPWSARMITGAGVGGLLLAGLVGLGWTLLRRNGRGPAPLSPDKWARRELDRIDGLAPPAAGAGDRYYTLLSDILRRYLELRFGFPAPEQTTAEILRALRQSDPTIEGQRISLQDLLERCDLAKFAGVAGTLEERRHAIDQARRLIEETARPLGSAPPSPTFSASGESGQG